MSQASWATGLTLLVFLSCTGSLAPWPGWARQFAAELECGMSLEEIRELADEEIQTLEAGAHPWLGRYYVRKRNADVWLRFNEQSRLQWVTLSRMDGWKVMATRQSPQRNLCTGELTYQIRLDWTVELEGAAVFLDDQEVQPDRGKITVSAGQHDVRIEKAGYEPIVRHLNLGPEDRGDQSLDLRQVELQPVPPEDDLRSRGAS